MLKKKFTNALKLGVTCALIPVLFSSCACYFWGVHCGEGASSEDPNTLINFLSNSASQKKQQPGDDKDTAAALPPKNKPKSKVRGILSNIEVGPTINFKSAVEEYSGYTKHRPGLGFNFHMGSYWSGLGKDLYLHPSIGFKQARAYEELEYGGGDGMPGVIRKDEYVFNYLSLPVLAEYRVSNDAIGLFAGPELNYLLKSTYSEDGAEKDNITDQSVRAGLGIQLGGVYRFHTRSNPNGKIRLMVRYDHRLSQLNKNNQPGLPSSVWRMKSLQLGLVYDICNCN